MFVAVNTMLTPSSISMIATSAKDTNKDFRKMRATLFLLHETLRLEGTRECA